MEATIMLGKPRAIKFVERVLEGPSCPRYVWLTHWSQQSTGSFSGAKCALRPEILYTKLASPRWCRGGHTRKGACGIGTRATRYMHRIKLRHRRFKVVRCSSFSTLQTV